LVITVTAHCSSRPLLLQTAKPNFNPAPIIGTDLQLEPASFRLARSDLSWPADLDPYSDPQRALQLLLSRTNVKKEY